MVKLVWTEPALQDLDAIAEYIALDKPGAAAHFVQKVLTKIERLELFPESGRKVEELPSSPYREISVPPCRIFFKQMSDIVFIIHVLRSERILRKFMLDEANDAV